MSSAPPQGLNQLAEAGRLESESLEAEKAQNQASADAQADKAQRAPTTPKGKVRKAYTITKQRERWTDSEHDRFLQALKRYGRAWRKIEEHIGTKTAVQIRSHAQKFFSKLQREQGSGGSLTDGSSKAGISIPPPRPKRKPMHPYPRKHGEGSEPVGASQQPSSSLQTSQQPQPQPQVPALPAVDLSQHGGIGIADASINAVLEAAAIAAAQAWSQVVARAGAQVQHQLQMQRVAAPQTLPFYAGMTPALLAQMTQAQAAHFRPTAGGAIPLQSSTQEPTGRSGSTLMNKRGTPDISLTGTSQPRTAGGTQSNYDSPPSDDAAADADGGDSACSREENRDLEMPQRDSGASSYGRQLTSNWQSKSAQEARLSRAAWNMVEQAANAAATSQWNPHEWVKPPQHAFSAGAVITAGSGGNGSGSGSQPVKDGSGSPKLGRSKSQTSQLAHNYQRAAAAEQQAINDAENGSSGDGSNSGDASGKLGLMRSDKGSNAGSDGDGQGSGSGSDNGNGDLTELAANAEKGSDDGSNSPSGFTRNGSLPKEAENAQTVAPTVASVGSPKVCRTPQVFGNFDPARMAAAATQLQQQGTLSMPQAYTPQQPFIPQQQALAAYQQQAMAAWTAAGATAQPGFHLLHSLFSGVQTANRRDFTLPVALNTPGESSLLDRKSSGQPSLDHFLPAATRSYSVPNTDNVDVHLAREEASGFQPYNKRHGMPLTSLPPAKRFAADAAVGKDTAPKPAVKGVGFSPFSAQNPQHMHL